MTYNPSIPQATDNLSTSQGQILNNFTQLNTVFSVDHFAFDDVTSTLRGKHRQCTFESLGADPTTLANEVALYNKSNELYIRQQSNATAFKLIGNFLAAQNGYITLYGSILMQWGRGFIAGGATNTTVTFPVAFSGTAYMVVDTPYNNPITGSTPREFGAESITATNFVAVAFNGVVPGGGCNFGWIAIGPA